MIHDDNEQTNAAYREAIIRMAQEAGAVPSGDPREWDVWLFQDPAIENFAALVTAEKDREILALKEERRKDMAEIHSLRELEESLREDNEQFAALIGEYAAEQAPDALQTENERLRDAARQMLSHDETAIWSARNDPRE